MIEPSKEAIEAAIGIFQPTTYRMSIDLMADRLKAAYAIDFASLSAEFRAAQSEIERLETAYQTGMEANSKAYDALHAELHESDAELEDARDDATQYKGHWEMARNANVEVTAQIAAANERIARSDEALKALQEATSSNNTENPWLGVCASVALLQMRIRELEAELQAAREIIKERDETLSEDVAPFAQEGDGLKWQEQLSDGTLIPVLRGSPRLAAFVTKLHNTAAELETELQAALDENKKLRTDLDSELMVRIGLRRRIRELESYKANHKTCLELAEEAHQEITTERRVNSSLRERIAELERLIHSKFVGVSFEDTPPGTIFIEMGKRIKELENMRGD